MGYSCHFKHFKLMEEVEGCGNSVSKHLDAVYNSPPHYCWRASLKMVGLGCADLERTPFGASDSSHSLDDGHPSLYVIGDVHDFKPYICHPSALLTGGIPKMFRLQSYT